MVCIGGSAVKNITMVAPNMLYDVFRKSLAELARKAGRQSGARAKPSGVALKRCMCCCAVASEAASRKRQCAFEASALANRLAGFSRRSVATLITASEADLGKKIKICKRAVLPYGAAMWVLDCEGQVVGDIVARSGNDKAKNRCLASALDIELCAGLSNRRCRPWCASRLPKLGRNLGEDVAKLILVFDQREVPAISEVDWKDDE